MPVAASLSETVKVTWSNRAAASKDLSLQNPEAAPLLHIQLFTQVWLRSTQYAESVHCRELAAVVDEPPLLQRASHLFIQSCVTCRNHTKLDTALPLALNNKHAKYQADEMNHSWDTRFTGSQWKVGLNKCVIFIENGPKHKKNKFYLCSIWRSSLLMTEEVPGSGLGSVSTLFRSWPHRISEGVNSCRDGLLLERVPLGVKLKRRGKKLNHPFPPAATWRHCSCWRCSSTTQRAEREAGESAHTHLHCF